MKKQSIRILFCSILILNCNVSFTAENAKDPMAIIESIIKFKTENSWKNSGMGSATVKEKEITDGNNISIEEYSTDFMFKNNMTRSDIKNIADPNGKVLKWFKNEHHTGLFSGNGIIISGRKEQYYYRQIGRDFNVHTFDSIMTLPVQEILKQLSSDQQNFSEINCIINDDNIISISFKEIGSNSTASYKFNFDGSKELVLTSYSVSINETSRTITFSLNNEWARFNSSYYITKSFYEEATTFTNAEEQNIYQSREVNIEKINCDVTIDDSKFSLKGLDLPADTHVSDHIAGISYRLDQTPIDEDVLKNTVMESTVYNNINDKSFIVNENVIVNNENLQSNKNISLTDPNQKVNTILLTKNNTIFSEILLYSSGILVLLTVGIFIIMRFK
ncbi:hypothetical protein ACFLZ8_02770 [Planctomycetota bacterium]